MKNEAKSYGACECCGGRVVEKRLTIDRRIGGRLIEVENVPVGVCTVCGNRIYKGPVLEQLERLARSSVSFERSIQVPVARYEAAETSE